MGMVQALPGAILVAVLAADVGAFWGKPPLGPADTLRRLFAPYDLLKLHVLGAAYCENLLDCRFNTTSYTHLNADAPWGDGYNLQFPDDAARLIECLAWESQHSPVVRIELARRLVKGMLANRVPGSFSDAFFRHRTGGKTFLIAGERQGTPGRLTLTMWGDEVTGSLKVGFRLKRGDGWLLPEGCTFSDPLDSLLEPGKARTDRWWHASPISVQRTYVSGDDRVVLGGRYWLSDDDKPLEYAVSAKQSDTVEAVIGEPGCPIPLLGDYRLPTTIHLPDRRTTFRSDTHGDRVFERPNFRYLILRKQGGAFAATGYSTALLIVWEGKPERVEVLADKGYGEARIRFAEGKGRVWLNPYHWLDDSDIELVHRSAESFLEHGKLPQNGFPTQQMLNAVPAGMAAGAYMLARYKDPMATTAAVNAVRTVDRLFAAEDEGKTLVRAFFPVRAAAWMVKLAAERGDSALRERYVALLDRAVRRMCSPAIGYDGSAWAGGWDHFNCMKALHLAYDATGNPAYREAFERALKVYTIDEKGIYRNGVKMAAPGGFDTYSGSLPLGVWGAAGKLDWVEKLINLEVPNGWHQPERLVRDTWNDAGAGPWAQDDANPEYLGLVLKGLGLPTEPKLLVPVGAFPSLDRSGKVTPSNAPLLNNPYCLPGPPLGGPIERPITSKPILLQPITCAGSKTVEYRLPLKDARGAALDFRIQGTGYRVEVSADGRRWIERLDTFDPKPADHSLDLGFLCGSRDELVRLLTLSPPDDRAMVSGATATVDGNRRYVKPGGDVVYRLNLPRMAVCRIEMIVGNGYVVEASADGKRWRRVASASDPDGGSGKLAADAAMIRMADVTDEAAHGRGVYLRVADAGGDGFAGRPAFVQRLVVYGALRSDTAWVRISNVRRDRAAAFTLERMTLRTWE